MIQSRSICITSYFRDTELWVRGGCGNVELIGHESRNYIPEGLARRRADASCSASQLTVTFPSLLFSAPRVWNSLPVSICESQSLPTFRRHLKAFNFQSIPFSCPPCLEYLCPRALILLRLWRYTSHVLTYVLIVLLANVNSSSCSLYVIEGPSVCRLSVVCL